MKGYIWHWIKRFLYYSFIILMPVILFLAFVEWALSNYTQKESELERRQVEAVEESVNMLKELSQQLDSLDDDLKNIHDKMRTKKGVINTYIHTKCIDSSDTIDK